MLTPSELREITLKSGLGYDKKEVDKLISNISADYEQLYLKNENLEKKVNDLEESIRYYKSIEKTLQKALVIAEKTAEDIKSTARKEAEAVILDAKTNAKIIESQALKQSEMLEHKTLNLLKQYDLFKAHFKNLLKAQMELLDSSSFSINTLDFSYREQWMGLEKDEDNKKSQALQQEDPKNHNNDKVDNNNPDTQEIFEFINIEDDSL
ncbi:MAG: DivIVA domain-containing protein [Clostridiales bacterium]|nr:DivIVA domain-containing protein [Clostridiales bacterium]